MKQLVEFLYKDHARQYNFIYFTNDDWGYHYIYYFRRFASRPKANPYCKAGVISFCPTGREANTMPTFADTDVVEVYALKAPVWEFKFGDLLAKFVSLNFIINKNILSHA